MIFFGLWFRNDPFTRNAFCVFSTRVRYIKRARVRCRVWGHAVMHSESIGLSEPKTCLFLLKCMCCCFEQPKTWCTVQYVFITIMTGDVKYCMQSNSLSLKIFCSYSPYIYEDTRPRQFGLHIMTLLSVLWAHSNRTPWNRATHLRALHTTAVQLGRHGSGGTSYFLLINQSSTASCLTEPKAPLEMFVYFELSGLKHTFEVFCASKSIKIKHLWGNGTLLVEVFVITLLFLCCYNKHPVKCHKMLWWNPYTYASMQRTVRLAHTTKVSTISTQIIIPGPGGRLL